MQSESLVPANVLVEQGPVRVKQYLTECEEGTREPANVDVILEVAEYRASNEASLEWAGIAVRAANLGAKENAKRRHSYLYRAMLLRTLFISKLGSRAGDAILDSATVVGWFYEELKFTPAEARQRAERWRDAQFQQEFAAELENHEGGDAAADCDAPEEETPPGETPHIKDTLNELLDLQLLKYRLQLLRRLAECGELAADAVNTEWLQTAKFLP
jgi:hypothetical protein